MHGLYIRLEKDASLLQLKKIESLWLHVGLNKFFQWNNFLFITVTVFVNNHS